MESKIEQGAVGTALYGDLPLHQSNYEITDKIVPISDLVKHAGEEVWVQANVHIIRAKAKCAFVILREQMSTMQSCIFIGGEVEKSFIDFIAGVPSESVVLVYGNVVALEGKRKVTGCTVQDAEMNIKRFLVVSRAIATLPILVVDAMRPESDYQKPGCQFSRVGIEQRLDNRVLDLRTPANQALFRIRSGITAEFRNYLSSKGFMEIQTPKIIGQSSEGGSAIFNVKYFDRKAYLAQSPQLYKQMCIAAGFEKVFEVGPVFRAENSLTNRHLTEFTGLDLEMSIGSNYKEVIRLLLDMLFHMIKNIYTKYEKEMETIAIQYPIVKAILPESSEKVPIITHREAVTLLQEKYKELEAKGETISPADRQTYEGDMLTVSEKLLGDIMHEKYGSDLYAVERYPLSSRPFYTMPSEIVGSEEYEKLKKAEENEEKIIAEDGHPAVRYSNSFDLFLRGNEICSGAQRVHNSEYLKTFIEERKIDTTPLKDYIDSFSYGCPPHAGAGLGLDRLVMLIVDTKGVRQSTLFPRTPARLRP